MALKNIWKDKVDDVDDVFAEDINLLARELIETQESKADKIDTPRAEDVYTKEEVDGKINTVYMTMNFNDAQKADKATTLEGYGIADAYTKEEADGKFQNQLTEQQLQNIEDVTSKVDKVDGKGLSTEDYTTKDKNKVKEVDRKADLNYVNESFANALKGKASGEAVGITDVSPIEHTMGVKARSKNIAFEVSGRDCAVGETSGGVVGFKSFTFEKGKTYTLSFDTENTGGKIQLVTHNRPLTMVSSSMVICNGTRQRVTFTMTDDFYRNYTVTWVQLRADSTANSGLCSNVMVEEGTTATAYTPYVKDVTTATVKQYGADTNAVIETHTINADGTVEGVTSVYPTTTLMTDTQGVVLDCEYNRDINKAFAELQTAMTNAIISLGGNV